MIETNVQKFLRNGGSLTELTTAYGIQVKRHKVYNNLCQLKYDMIDSPMGERIVQECRGIILDEAANWKCVARPFDKFFNYGEGHAASIDWQTAQVATKLDGSLMFLYNYEKTDHSTIWEVASSGLPDASGQINGAVETFYDLFWKTFDEIYLGKSVFGQMPTHITYIFELTSPQNRVVVPYTKADLHLIGLRNRDTGEEYNIHKFTHPFKSVGMHPLMNWDETIETFKTLDPMRNEGYVVTDKDFNRVKIKHPGYVAIHHLKDSVGTSDRNILDIIRTGEHSEFLSYFPEFEGRFIKLAVQYDMLQAQLELDYARIKAIPVQKDFAIEAVKSQCSGALFALRAGKAPSIAEYLRKLPIDRVLEYMK